MSHKSHSRTVGDQATVTQLQEPPECTRAARHFFFCSPSHLSLSLSECRLPKIVLALITLWLKAVGRSYKVGLCAEAIHGSVT